MSSARLYDTIGATYTVTRRTEPQIAARIWAALGDARTVLNVGAGSAGLREMRRVARRVVVFTFDGSDTGWRRRFWLTRDYLPEVGDLLVGRPSLAEQARAIGARMEPVLIPWDCADGFFEAYWRRPEAYLDEKVRRGISVWARIGPEPEQRAVRSLRDDLVSGRWAARNRDLVVLDAAELGLRLLVT